MKCSSSVDSFIPWPIFTEPPLCPRPVRQAEGTGAWGICHAFAFVELASRGSRLVDSLTFGSCWCCYWTPILFIHPSSQYPRFRSLRESDEHRLVRGSPWGVTCHDRHSQQVHMEWGKPGSPKTKWAALTNRGNKCWVGTKRSPPYLILIVWRQEWESSDLAENSGQSYLYINKYNLGCVSITFLKVLFVIYIKWK